MNRRGNPPKAAVAAQLKRMRRQMARELNGFTFKPNPTPPPISQAPWNSLVVTRSVSTPDKTPYLSEYKISDIWTAAQIQMGFGTSTILAELRFQKVEVWAVNDAGSTAVALFVYDVSDVAPNTRLFSRQEDHCGRNQWARCGYEWPRSIQNITCESASQAPVFDVSSAAATTGIYSRVHLLWRGTTGAVPALHGAPAPTRASADLAFEVVLPSV